MSEQVIVFDTTLRDGEQSAGVCFSVRDKVEIAARLAELHVDVIEAGFPANSAAEALAVEQVGRVVRDTRVCALARAVARDVDAAGAALRSAARPRIHVFVNSSDDQLVHQLRRNRDEVVEMAASMVRRARDYADDVEFSPMDATRADVDFVARLARAAIGAGATTLNIPDTVGFATPEHVRELIQTLFVCVPELEGVVVSFHGQDDLGMATANALTAVSAGARQLEVAVNGIGERAGNTSFEEVVAALHVHGAHLGVHTGVDLRGVCSVSRLVEERSGLPVPPNKPVVGRNAFRHASGVHQDGVLKHRGTYELLDPALIGHPVGSQIVLGKLSGRGAFAHRALALGFELSGAVLDRAFARFQALAEQKAEVADEDLRAICAPEDAGARVLASGYPGFALDL